MYGQYTNSDYSGKRWKLGEGLPVGATHIKREGHNRQSYIHPDGSRRYRLHATDVVILRGSVVTLDDGGYATVTTRRAMSEGIENLCGVNGGVFGDGRSKHAHVWRCYATDRRFSFNCPHSLDVSELVNAPSP